MEPIHSLEITVSLLMQSLGNWLLTPMSILSYLGQEQFYLLLLPLIYWCFDATLGLRVGVVFLLMQFSNALLKLTLRQPRPFWTDARVMALSVEESFGMPSGHAQSAVGIWGLLGVVTRRGRVTAGVITLIFLIGVSRIYLGMHFASDVLAGWLIGGLLLWLYLRLEPGMTRWIGQVGYRGQLGLAAGSSLAIILLALGTRTLLPPWNFPAEWAMTATQALPSLTLEPDSLEGIFTIAGTWFGFLGGAAWAWHFHGKPAPAAKPHHRVLRYLVGVAGVIVLWSGLGTLFAGVEGIAGFTLRYLRYTLIGLWVAALAPLLFTRLGIGGFVKSMSR